MGREENAVQPNDSLKTSLLQPSLLSPLCLLKRVPKIAPKNTSHQKQQIFLKLKFKGFRI